MKRNEINRIIRKLLDMTCADLAKRVQLTKQTISNYENNKTHNRVLERVIELELDMAIESCENEKIKEICMELQKER